MLIDGRKIANDLAGELKVAFEALPQTPVLLVIQVGEDPASSSFIRAKQKFAEKVGVEVRFVQFSNSVSETELQNYLRRVNGDPRISAVIVQLPLPGNIRASIVLDLIDPTRDPDLLSFDSRELFRLGRSKILPPVVSAVAEILTLNRVYLSDLDIAVVGDGKLVGEPVGVWLGNQKLEYALVTSETKNIKSILQNADVIISGAGSPGLIKPDMLKDGVVLIDAGTSEEGGKPGKLAGDADPACLDKCALFTPVPGGVGPIAVAMLFQNLLKLSGETAQ